MLIKNRKYYIFTNEKGEKYLSFAKILKPFREEQDWDAILQKSAKKKGVDPVVLKAEWDAKGDLGKLRGKIYHEQMEQYYMKLAAKGKANIFFCDKDNYTFPDCKLKNNAAYIEKIVWDDETKTFGIADFIQVKDGKINMIDYKTNASIDFEAFADRKFLGALSHLPDCNYYEYCLQCSLYMWLALKANPEYSVGDMYLEHIIFNEDNTIKEKLKLPINYYGEEIKSIIYG